MKALIAALAAGLALGAAVGADAATWRVDLFDGTVDDPYGDGIADGTGIITAPPLAPGGTAPLTTASITLGGTTYAVLETFHPVLQSDSIFSGATILDGLVHSTALPADAPAVASIWFFNFGISNDGGLTYQPRLSWATALCLSYSCYNPSERGGGYRLTELDMPAVPLPATAALLPAGLAGLAGLRRRRRRG